MYAREHSITILGIVDPEKAVGDGAFSELPVFDGLDALGSKPDACIITNLHQPQATYDALIKTFPAERVLCPRLLELKTQQPAKRGKL